MRSLPIAVPSVTVTEATLKGAPARLLVFLEGVGDPAIRAQLKPYGWSDSRHQEAWALLTQLIGKPNATGMLPASDSIGDAIRSCEAWQTGGLVRARALVELTHPEQAELLFGDLVAGKGMAAVMTVMTFLERHRALSSSAERKSTRKADHEALLLIEESGTTKDTLKELAATVEAAQAVAPAAPDGALVAEKAAKRIEVLRKIHVWLSTWTEIARTVVTRRTDQIHLGIAKRRAPKAKKVTAPPAPPQVPTAPSPSPSPEAPTTPVVEDADGPASRAA